MNKYILQAASQQGALLNVLPPPDILGDGNTLAWFDSQYLDSVVKNESNAVSSWGDRMGSALGLTQEDTAKQPIWSTDGILFDGVDDVMKKSITATNQPLFFYVVFNLKSYSATLVYLFDGDTGDRMCVSSGFGETHLRAFAGTISPTIAYTANTTVIGRFLFNGANSKAQINEETAVLGNFGTQTSNGITLGARGYSTYFTNILYKDIIVRKVADTPNDESVIYNYLKIKNLL